MEQLGLNPHGWKQKFKINTGTAESTEPLDFDLDPFTFKPLEVDLSGWPGRPGARRLPYSVLVGVYVQVSSTRSRLKIVRVLTNFIHFLLQHFQNDLIPSLYLLSNHLKPSYVPCELGIGSQILSRAIQEVSGLQPRDLKKLWEKWGDPGDVAFEAKNNLRTLIKPNPLGSTDVYRRMVSLSGIKGAQSGKVKGDVVRRLMVAARGEEVRFLVRSLVGNLRIGAVRLTLLTSLARATAIYLAPQDLLASIRPLPADPPKAAPGQKRVPRPKPQPDPARDKMEELCIEAVKLVRKVYVRHPNYSDLGEAIIKGGLIGLEDRVPVSVGVPLSPMLGSITRSLGDVFTRLGTLPFTAEAKLDGQRVQIHARRNGPQGQEDGGGRWVQNDQGDKVWVRLFSRHLEDMTEKYPDICQMVLALLLRPLPASRTPFPSTSSEPLPDVIALLSNPTIDSFIMDAEVVAIDKTTGAYRTFQELTNRAKKDVRVEDIKVVVGVYAFDLMLLNDQPLLNSPFSHRRHILRTLFPPFSVTSDPLIARFKHVECLDSLACTDITAEMQAFFETVVEQKCEGLMVKLLESGEGITGDDEEPEDGDDGGARGKKAKGGQGPTGGKKKPLPATYEPDQRSQGWLKVKKDYLEGLGDSLDLVPIGAWWGQGRKAGWWSPILLACHNAESGALEAVCKCFTDQFYKDLIARYPPHNAVPEKCNTDSQLSYCDTGGLRPDVWFSPDEVWEIRGADITLSPVYPAAASLLGSERGLSIRFPRFMKLREDKSWEQATSSEQFADMYRRQIREAPARKAPDEAGGGEGGSSEIGVVRVREGSDEGHARSDDVDEDDEQGEDEDDAIEDEDLQEDNL
ncbi:ATP-dependent DNA ligase [Kockovaella imperatae]|uniref:ATP-dependent DNA ligase n=1 Tax=Kockovaella imperatae TaxID=4999 RepID=A0A1Y1UEN5_9TREE|nr:ATP-dependent DNA ligase [Kockovaella imperatae]ORX36503.1 ATP-dependent DNA ligase [Kockovaella imperatae]